MEEYVFEWWHLIIIIPLWIGCLYLHNYIIRNKYNGFK